MSYASELTTARTMGQFGFKYLKTGGTETYTGDSIAIQCISESNITCTSVNGDNLSDVTFGAGAVIVGRFTSVTVSGSDAEILAYLAK